jgi:hypothetical protein
MYVPTFCLLLLIWTACGVGAAVFRRGTAARHSQRRVVLFGDAACPACGHL